MNKKILYYIGIFLFGIIATLLALFWFKLFPKGTDLDLSALLTFLGIIGALIGVLLSTNKQIKNQNKESHRPYVEVQKIVLAQQNKEKRSYRIYIVLKNIGYGVAQKISLQQIDETESEITIIEYNSNYYNEYLSLGVDNESSKSKIDVMSNNKELTFLIFYSDLNYNIYCQYLWIDMSNCITDFCDNINYEVLTEDDPSFIPLLTELNVDYAKQKTLYMINHYRN